MKKKIGQGKMTEDRRRRERQAGDELGGWKGWTDGWMESTGTMSSSVVKNEMRKRALITNYNQTEPASFRSTFLSLTPYSSVFSPYFHSLRLALREIKLRAFIPLHVNKKKKIFL